MIFTKNKYIRNVWLFASILILFMTGCTSTSASPTDSVSVFFNGIKNSDISKAENYLVKGDTTLTFQNQGNKNIVKRVFSMSTYDIISTSLNNNSAVVKVKVISPNMEKMTVNMINEVMSQVGKITAQGGMVEAKDSEKMAEEYYNKMLSEPKLEKITSELDINLVLEDGKWLIKGNQSLKDAITGNITKFANNAK